VRPLHGALLGRAVPLDGALPGTAGRHPVQPQDEAAGAGADTASARLAGPGRTHPQCRGIRAVRRSALPVAAVRRAGTLPARRGPGHLLDRTDQLAEGSRAGPVTGRTLSVPLPAPASGTPVRRTPIAPRIGQLRAREVVTDHEAGANVGVWAGRTITAT